VALITINQSNDFKHQQSLKEIISRYMSVVNLNLNLIYFQFYTMRIMTDMEIVWLQNVQMGLRKKLQRGVHH
jgi:hypothetical protein